MLPIRETSIAGSGFIGYATNAGLFLLLLYHALFTGHPFPVLYSLLVVSGDSLHSIFQHLQEVFKTCPSVVLFWYHTSEHKSLNCKSILHWSKLTLTSLPSLPQPGCMWPLNVKSMRVLPCCLYCCTRPRKGTHWQTCTTCWQEFGSKAGSQNVLSSTFLFKW